MADLTAAESDCQTIMLQLPAIPDPSWPVGKDERENVVTRTWSDPAHSPLQLDAGGKDHVTLGKELGIMDLERGVKLAGSRSYILRGLGARLYWSVLRFAQDFLVARGYELMVVPVLVSEQCMIGTGYAELQRRMHDRMAEVGAWLRKVVLGYYQYHAVPGNTMQLRIFKLRVCRLWQSVLVRRSQRAQMRWERFTPVLNRWIPPPRVLHPYPDARFYATHPS